MNSKFPFWGIDGCTGGWFCVGLNGEDGDCDCLVAADIETAHREIKTRGAKIALIDIPIGLSDNADERVCDKRARRFIAPKTSSVFRVPCRQAIGAYKQGKTKTEAEALGILESIRITGGPLSKQTWGIAGKIAEVDDFLQSGKGGGVAYREVHPEVCFWALNGCAALANNKKKPEGKTKRLAICAKYFPAAQKLLTQARGVKGVVDDDILDALAAAITAKLGDSDKYHTLPESPPPDSAGLKMEMVYCARP